MCKMIAAHPETVGNLSWLVWHGHRVGLAKHPGTDNTDDIFHTDIAHTHFTLNAQSEKVQLCRTAA